jgi:hypothetical protein
MYNTANNMAYVLFVIHHVNGGNPGYVISYIVSRKSVDDLRKSPADHRTSDVIATNVDRQYHNVPVPLYHYLC